MINLTFCLLGYMCCRLVQSYAYTQVSHGKNEVWEILTSPHVIISTQIILAHEKRASCGGFNKTMYIRK